MPLHGRTSGRRMVRSGPPALQALFQSAELRTDCSHCHFHPWCLPICPVVPVRCQLLISRRNLTVSRNFTRSSGGHLSLQVLLCTPCNGTGDSRRVLASMTLYLGQSDGLSGVRETRMSAIRFCGSRLARAAASRRRVVVPTNSLFCSDWAFQFDR